MASTSALFMAAGSIRCWSETIQAFSLAALGGEAATRRDPHEAHLHNCDGTPCHTMDNSKHKQMRLPTIVGIGCAALALSWGASEGQNLSKTQKPLSSITFSTSWTAADGPYKEVAKKIKRDHDNGQSPAAIVQEWQAQVARRPGDSVAQFALVVALRGQFLTLHREETLPYRLVQQLKAHDPGNSYSYTRYLFCMSQEARRTIPADVAQLVGNKLLEADPQDNWVRQSLIDELCDSVGGAKQALSYAYEWTKIQPTNNKAHWALGLVFFDLWEESGEKSREYATKGTTAFQKSLTLMPPGDPARFWTNQYIAGMKHSLI